MNVYIYPHMYTTIFNGKSNHESKRVQGEVSPTISRTSERRFGEGSVMMVNKQPQATPKTHCKEHFVGGNDLRKGCTMPHTAVLSATRTNGVALERRGARHFFLVCLLCFVLNRFCRDLFWEGTAGVRRGGGTGW